MPNGNRTGPNGQGPMTGRVKGYCGGFGAPGYAGQHSGRCNRGRGLGLKKGLGRGMSAFCPQDVTASSIDPNQQCQILKAQAQSLSETLESIKSQIEQIENSTENKG